MEDITIQTKETPSNLKQVAVSNFPIKLMLFYILGCTMTASHTTESSKIYPLMAIYPKCYKI